MSKGIWEFFKLLLLLQFSCEFFFFFEATEILNRLDIDIDTSKDIKDRNHNTWHSIKSWKYHVTEHAEMEEIKHTTGAIKGNNREMRK